MTGAFNSAAILHRCFAQARIMSRFKTIQNKQFDQLICKLDWDLRQQICSAQ
jgi:hypothetical protein